MGKDLLDFLSRKHDGVSKHIDVLKEKLGELEGKIEGSEDSSSRISEENEGDSAMADFDIGVCIFCHNEEKFIGYSIKSFLAAPCVKCVAVIEGAIRNVPTGADKNGLSTDRTAEIVKNIAIEDSRVVFKQFGWCNDKAQLQNAGFEIITKKLGGGAIHMLAGADELYKPKDLARLQAHFMSNPSLKVLGPTFRHYWWRPDLVACGGNWETKMHRAYRSPGKMLVFAHHAAPPGDCATGGQIKVDDVVVYHFIGMKDAPEIRAKLELYKRRDGHRLNVVDTWSNWKWGDSTQWTHGGGSAKRFEGEHPEVIAKDVWNLTPRDEHGKKLPLPAVPWDPKPKEEKRFVKRRVGIFLEEGIPDDDAVKKLIATMIEQGHKVVVYTLDDDVPAARELGIKDVRDLDARSLRGNELALFFPNAFCFAPQGARHVAVLYKKPRANLDLSGYVVYQTPGAGLGHETVPLPDDFVETCLDGVPVTEQRTPRAPDRPSERIATIERPSGPYRRKGPIRREPHRAMINTMLSGERQGVQIRNTGREPWTPQRHELTVRWWNGDDSMPVPGGPTVILPIEETIQPGEILSMDVPIPDWTELRQSGVSLMTLVIDIRQDRRHMLNVGTRTKRFFR